MGRPGRPPADIKSIVRYLVERGPQPGKALMEAAARGDLPLGEKGVRSHLATLLEEGWVTQRRARGDYYPARDPDTGAPVHVAVLSPSEMELVRASREAA